MVLTLLVSAESPIINAATREVLVDTFKKHQTLRDQHERKARHLGIRPFARTEKPGQLARPGPRLPRLRSLEERYSGCVRRGKSRVLPCKKQGRGVIPVLPVLLDFVSRQPLSLYVHRPQCEDDMPARRLSEGARRLEGSEDERVIDLQAHRVRIMT